MASYQISTVSSVNSFVFTPVSVTRNNGVFQIRVKASAHIKFVQEALEAESQFLIRSVAKEKDTFKVISATQWKKLPSNVQFYDNFGARIEAGLLEGLEDFESLDSLSNLPEAE